MTQTSTKLETYRSGFQALQRGPAANEPSWLSDLRQHAWSRFTKLGFPTARRGNEKWKYTNVRPLATANFDSEVNGRRDSDTRITNLGRLAPSHDGWLNLVFLDGYFADYLSTGTQKSNGVVVSNLADAIALDNPIVQQHLAKHAEVEDDGFTALNTAFLQDGAFVHIADGHEAPAPLHLIFVTTDRERETVSYPRTLVIAGRGARLSLVESYVSLSDSRYFTNAVTELVLEDGAEVDHYRLLLESTEAFHVGTSRVHQGQDSTFRSGSFTKGAALARNDFQVTLDATGAACFLNGLYMTSGTQHIDNLINIDHAKPHTKSRLVYKGILDGKSRAVFGGTVLVRKDAQKSDARQTDKNLLLSESAEVDSKPSLLIYADDVQCGHGATAGHIDQDTVFYMRSRGLDQEMASRMLVHAFAREIIDTVDIEPLRDYLDDLFLGATPTARVEFGGVA